MERAEEVLKLIRFFFVLPEPLPFADGIKVTGHVSDNPNQPGSADSADPWVVLTFHQRQSDYGRSRGSMEAVEEVIATRPDLPRPQSGAAHAPSDKTPIASYTVVEALTTYDSPDPPPPEWAGDPRDLPPRADAFNRCLRLANDLMRAYRIASNAPYGLPTYERIPSIVLLFMADGERIKVDEDGIRGELVGVRGEWAGPSIMLLEHLNLPDVAAGPEITGDLTTRCEHWLEELRGGSPFFLWRERLAEARRALAVDGDYSVAVLLSLTASEVLLDGLLALLLWEEGKQPQDAAQLFDEGKVTGRVKAKLHPRLGGNWDLNGNGPVATWFHQAMRLRHRVVHGGYRPTRVEAQRAFDATLALERYVFDRLASKRTKYPRSTLMTIAEPGLRGRGLWSGQIKRFAEQVAPSEPSWRDSFGRFLNILVETRVSSDI